ncbi:MAG: ABC transporter ATP-binding protein [Bacteroidota bacterium]
MTLQISHLSKVYPNGVRALDDLSLEIGRGMFGLLGPNGAGKSSLMRTIATLQRPDSGQLFFEGINLLEDKMALRKILGYLPQEFGVYPKVSAERLLDYFARLKGVASRKERGLLIDEVLAITNLQDVRRKHVSSYSGGMKQRFGIAQLLLNRPRLIIVDEPTAGLDPAERVRFLNILREIGTQSTVIFSTHIVEDVRNLCQDLAIINKGRLLLKSQPDAALQQLNGQVWTRKIDREQLAQAQQDFTVLSSAYNLDNSLQIRVWSLQAPTDEFEPTDPQLEDVYFLSLLQSQTDLSHHSTTA